MFAIPAEESAVHRGDSQSPKRWRASFGPFELSPDERLLQRDGTPVRLGGRALDLLIALVENAGGVVSKKDLLSKVWGAVVVDEGSLRFNMYAVRKALGDGQGGERYIVNTANKGYSFVARVERRDADGDAVAAASANALPLPALASAIVGREAEIKTIVAGLLQRRFVSIVGSGGTGKTTVATAAAQAAAKRVDHEVHFVDLSHISAAGLVRSTVASAVGLQTGRDDLPAIAAHLAESKALIVLDCCEHVISGAAELAEWLVRSCPAVHVLATSREPLLAEGEFVFRLQPLAFPPEGEAGTAEEALSYPAVRLFVDRAAAGGSGFDLTDRDAPPLAQLCRELDGIPLAIELAAGRVEALGLKAITSHFDASVRLMWHGRRTAVPRHQTLSATLDWSFNLLADDEKRLLCRLSVFAGTCSMEAAIEVCCFDLERSLAIELMAGLVSKSLLNVDAGGASLRYGMLDTTKSYCWKRLAECGYAAAIAERFCNHIAALAHELAARDIGEDGMELARPELANMRAALDRCLADAGKSVQAVELAASLCSLLLKLSRLAECSRWAQSALSRLPPELRGSRAEVQLQGALGQSLMFTGGDLDVAVKAFQRGIGLAEELRDFRSSLHLLNGQAVLLHRVGRYAEALAVARKAQSLLAEVDEPESRSIVDSLMGVALHLVGRVDEASRYFEKSAPMGGRSRANTTSRLGFDHYIRARCGIARTLWLTGQYSMAVTVAEETIAEASRHGHAVTHCIALLWAGSVFVYASDVERLEGVVEALERVARRHSLTPYLNVASMTRGQILIARGRAGEGVERIRTAMVALHECHYEMVSSVALTFLAHGLSDVSLHAAAAATCDEAERMIRTGGDLLRLPELLIARGRVLAAAGERDGAAKNWMAAIDLARTQGAVSGQLRASIALARHWIDEGKLEAAHSLLRPHVIAAGHETSSDLTLARSLLR